jgi:DNA polymerase-3 subunit epsilon
MAPTKINMLHLKRPIAFFDLETTGITITTDRIIDIAIIKLMPNNAEQQKKIFRLNPGIPIPAASTAIHGITDSDVVDKPFFKDVANEIKQFIDNCDLAGYNSNRFDIPLLTEEFLRVGLEVNLKDRKLVDVQQIFMKMERRTLEAAYKFYCNKQLVNSHSAEADTQATLEVLMGQLAMYSDLDGSVEQLHDMSKGEDFADFSRRIKIVNDIPVFNFGKYKEQSVKEVFTKEAQYYNWMMKGDFAQDTKAVITEIYTKIKLKL